MYTKSDNTCIQIVQSTGKRRAINFYSKLPSRYSTRLTRVELPLDIKQVDIEKKETKKTVK